MVGALATLAVCVALAFWWERRDRRRGVPNAILERENEHGVRLFKRIAVAIAVAAVALVLAQLGVPGAALFGVAAVLALTLLVWFGPWLGLRRR